MVFQNMQNVHTRNQFWKKHQKISRCKMLAQFTCLMLTDASWSQMSRFLSQASEKNSELEVMGGFIKSGTWMGFNKNDMLSNA